MRYEEVLKQTSGIGLHRVLLLGFISLSSLRQGTVVNIIIFSLSSPTLVCDFNTTEVSNSTGNEIPADSVGWCKARGRLPDDGRPCERWRYSDPHSKLSAVQEWNLCGEQNKILLIQTASILAFGIFGSVAANLADRYGRIKLYLIFAILDCIVVMTQSFSVNYWMYLVCNTILNAAAGGLTVTFYCYLNEILHPRQRRYFEFFAFITFALSHGMTSGAAYLTASWRMTERIQFLYSGIAILIIIVALGESPKWLYVMNRPKEAKTVLQKMATMNRLPRISEEYLNSIEISKEKRATRPSDLFHSTQLLKNAGSTITVTTLAVMVYYIISWNAGHFLLGSLYVNTFVMGLTEMPNCFLFLILVRFISKKWLIMSSLTICGSFLAAGAIFRQLMPDTGIASNILIFISRMAANFTHNALYSFVPEVFPTSLRTFGFGISNLGSRLLSAPMPYILLSAKGDNILVPSLVMATIVVLGTLTLICLPNTYGCRLPDTLEEARLFKRGSEHLFRIDKETFLTTKISEENKKEETEWIENEAEETKEMLKNDVSV